MGRWAQMYLYLQITAPQMIWRSRMVQCCDSPLDWAKEGTLMTLKHEACPIHTFSYHTFHDGNGQQQGEKSCQLRQEHWQKHSGRNFDQRAAWSFTAKLQPWSEQVCACETKRVWVEERQWCAFTVSVNFQSLCANRFQRCHKISSQRAKNYFVPPYQTPWIIILIYK